MKAQKSGRLWFKEKFFNGKTRTKSSYVILLMLDRQISKNYNFQSGFFEENGLFPKI